MDDDGVIVDVVFEDGVLYLELANLATRRDKEYLFSSKCAIPGAVSNPAPTAVVTFTGM